VEVDEKSKLGVSTRWKGAFMGVGAKQLRRVFTASAGSPQAPAWDSWRRLSKDVFLGRGLHPKKVHSKVF
jgi:hypothetical protein